MLVKQKTFLGADEPELDRKVNAFIGRQDVDGRTVFRKVIFTDFAVSGGALCKTIIYEETNLTGE
jgi:hypothetical protein